MANRTQAQPRPVTFDINDPAFLAIVQQAVEVRLAACKPEAKTEPAKVDYDALTIKTFKRAGFGDVQPRVNVKTFNLWLEAGFRVKPGETAVRVKQLRLFHVSQVAKMTAAEAREAQAALEAKAQARTADKLPKPALIEPAKPAVAAPAKKQAKRKTVPITQSQASAS